jgi:hypothetical protein
LFLVTFTNTLRFEIKDCDPTTGEADPEGFEDEYQVEDIEVTTSDYIRSSYVSDFAGEFEGLSDNEAIDTFALDKEKAHNLKSKKKQEYNSFCIESFFFLLFFFYCCRCLRFNYRFVRHATFRR